VFIVRRGSEYFNPPVGSSRFSADPHHLDRRRILFFILIRIRFLLVTLIRDPYPDPNFQEKAQNLEKVLK
jgi:hypothetical protein